jgi:hypothetical protein
VKFGRVDLTTFLESSNEGNRWKVMIIEEGLSKNGSYYPRTVLEEAAPLFEKSQVRFFEFDKKFFNHLPLAIEKMVKQGFPAQIAGFLENVKFETINVDGRDRSGLTGFLNLFDTETVKPLKETLVNSWKKGLKNFLGLSINADGERQFRMVNGIPSAIVKSIKQVFSTDFVTQPAAGGGLLGLIESINQQEGVEHMFKKFLESLKAWKPALLEGIDIANVTQEEVAGIVNKLIQESTGHKESSKISSLLGLIKESKVDEAFKILEGVITSEKEAYTADADAKKKKMQEEADAKKVRESEEARQKKEAEDKRIKESKEKEDRLAAVEHRLQVGECKEMLQTKLAESKLPQPYKNKIKKQYEGKIFKESEVDETIKLERETLAALVESRADFNFGGDVEGSFIEKEPTDRLQASLDLMLDSKINESEKTSYEGIEAFKSLKEAYIAFTDDPMVTGNMGKKAMARMQEADSTSFSYALGFSMQRRMLRDYKTIDPLWRRIASVTNVPDFKLQERIRWGGFGQLPQVLDARTSAGTPIDSTTPTYPELGFPQDQESTYAVATKGGIVTLTRRMIIDDDLNVLTKIPGKIGRAAANTLNRFVFDLMLNVSAGTINGGTIYDAIALYATAHKNYRTAALSHDNLKNLLDDMYHQGEFGTKTLITDNPLTSGATTINVTAGTGQYFKAGDMLWAEGEMMLVSSVSTDALTVTRGQFGTSGAAHVLSTPLYKVTEILALQNPILWVPRSLRSVALALKNSPMNPEGAEQEVNTIRDSFEPIVSPFLRGDENNFYLSARPEDVEGIEIGFLQGKEEPEILVQDQPTQGNVFQYDTIRYKVRHEYGGSVVDFRAFAAGIVA